MTAAPIPPTGNLTADDVAWAHELAASFITTALVLSEGSPTTDPADDTIDLRDGAAAAAVDPTTPDPATEAIYAAARSQALSVNTADGLGADRWLASMFFLAAHSAALLRQLAEVKGISSEALWQEMLLRRAGRTTS